MTELVCEILYTGKRTYDDMPPDVRQKIADTVPPHIITEGVKAIMSYLGAGPKPSLHYILIV